MSSRDCGQTTNNNTSANNANNTPANNANNTSANNANNRNNVRFIDNSDTIGRIARLTTSQITNNLFENNLLNGTSFNDDNSFVSLILPAGVLYNSLFS
jgi:hypothetical protein